MLEEIYRPAFFETDRLGHINNTRVPQWFERARAPLFRLFTPDFENDPWRLALVRLEIDYRRFLQLGDEVTLVTGIIDIGRTSMTVRQEAVQHQKVCAVGKTVLVHYDYQRRASEPLSAELRLALKVWEWRGRPVS